MIITAYYNYSITYVLLPIRYRNFWAQELMFKYLHNRQTAQDFVHDSYKRNLLCEILLRHIFSLIIEVDDKQRKLI